MISDERRQRLIDLIAERGFIDLATLVDRLNVSESTIRRDLAQLEEDGLIKRTHGGAVFISERQSALNFSARESTALAEKRAIGQATAELIHNEEVVLINGGTTAYQVARHLVGRPMRVVTNSLPIANLLGAAPEVELMVIGGYLYPRTGVMMGPAARDALKSVHANKAIMGCAGITAQGFFNANALMVEIEQVMMQCADEVIIVADRSKFGRAALARICELSAPGCLICDDTLEPSWQNMVRSAGIRLVLAPTAVNATQPAEARA
jgi:DeoR family transcriptional regulator, fructose operon transcriptional repressor